VTGLPFGSPPRPKRGPTLFDQLSGITDEPAADEKPAGSFEEQAAAEIGELEAGIKSRKKAERDRFRAATDSEFWFAVCFTSRDEKDRFLKAAGLWEHGDKYLDGQVVADTFDVDMT
jgi:hypothetical protein